jgi:hypothetical protein
LNQRTEHIFKVLAQGAFVSDILKQKGQIQLVWPFATERVLLGGAAFPGLAEGGSMGSGKPTGLI